VHNKSARVIRVHGVRDGAFLCRRVRPKPSDSPTPSRARAHETGQAGPHSLSFRKERRPVLRSRAQPEPWSGSLAFERLQAGSWIWGQNTPEGH